MTETPDVIEDPEPAPGSPHLPPGTAYITPDHEIGVIGYDYPITGRPLAGANIDALFAFANEVRKEATYH